MAANMMYTAISGLNTFNQALSVVSNNIANANTTAYKSQSVDFGNLVSGYMPTVYSSDTAQGVGSAILSTSADQGTGTEMQTNLWSNLMVQGSGFFEVKDSAGADHYTRDGAFQIDTKGYLTDANDDQVLDNGSAPISMTNSSTGALYASYSIDKNGVVWGTDSTGTQTSIATIGITTFANPNGLVSQGNNLFTTGPDSGTGTLGAPGDTTGAGTLISGALEGSNVDLTSQMVNLINYQADYQANSKSIVTGNNLLQTVVNLISG
ncbi:MAG: flagellar hook-basal body protein [Syntrophobacteraceae bacterium]